MASLPQPAAQRGVVLVQHPIGRRYSTADSTWPHLADFVARGAFHICHLKRIADFARGYSRMESVSNCSSPTFVYVRSARIAGSSSPARSAPRGEARTYFDDRLLRPRRFRRPAPSTDPMSCACYIAWYANGRALAYPTHRTSGLGLGSAWHSKRQSPARSTQRGGASWMRKHGATDEILPHPPAQRC
jgi:hypothetical protein